MTNTLTDRERELVEAAKVFFGAFGAEGGVLSERLARALRAYDPPKRKYTMPSWENFAAVIGERSRTEMWRGQETKYCDVGGISIGEFVYNAIREALAVEENP